MSYTFERLLTSHVTLLFHIVVKYGNNDAWAWDRFVNVKYNLLLYEFTKSDVNQCLYKQYCMLHRWYSNLIC